MAAQDTAHVDTEARAQPQLTERLTDPGRVVGNDHIRDVNVPVDELILEERSLPSFHPGHDLTRVEVGDEAAFHTDRPLLQSARENHQDDDDDGNRDDDGIGKTCQIVADIKEDRGCYRHTEENGEDQRQPVEATLCPKQFKLLAVVVLHHQSPHERRDTDEREQACRSVGPPVRQQMTEKLKHKRQHNSRHGNAKHGIDQRIEPHLLQQTPPHIVLLRRCLMRRTHVVEPTHPATRHQLRQTIVSRYRCTDHIRRDEGRHDTHRHDDGIDKVADDFQRQAQRGDDERELTDLRHGETAAHSRLQRLTRKHVTERAKDSLPHHDRQNQNDDRHRIADQHMRIDEHTHRNEEDGTKQILHRRDNFLYALHLDGLC